MDVMNAAGEVETAVVVSSDGEMEWITATVEIPIEDGDLTETQMLRFSFLRFDKDLGILPPRYSQRDGNW